MPQTFQPSNASVDTVTTGVWWAIATTSTAGERNFGVNMILSLLILARAADTAPEIPTAATFRFNASPPMFECWFDIDEMDGDFGFMAGPSGTRVRYHGTRAVTTDAAAETLVLFEFLDFKKGSDPAMRYNLKTTDTDTRAIQAAKDRLVGAEAELAVATETLSVKGHQHRTTLGPQTTDHPSREQRARGANYGPLRAPTMDHRDNSG